MRINSFRPLALSMTVVAALALSAVTMAQNRLQNGSFEVSHYSLGLQKLNGSTGLQNYDLDYWCFNKNDVDVWSNYGATNGRTMVHTRGITGFATSPFTQTFNLFGCRQAMSQPFSQMPNILLFDCLAWRDPSQPNFSATPSVGITGGTSTNAWNFKPVGTVSPINGWRTLARVFSFNPNADCQTLGFLSTNWGTKNRMHFDNFYLFNCRDFDPALPQSARGYTATNGTATDGHIASMFSLDSRRVKLSSGTSKQCGIILAGYVGATVPATFSMTYDLARDPDCGPVYAYVSIYDFMNQRWRVLNPNYGWGHIGYPIGVTNTFRSNSVSTSLTNHHVPVTLPTGPNNLVIWKIDFSPYEEPLPEPFPGSPPYAYPCLGVDVDRIQIF